MDNKEHLRLFMRETAEGQRVDTRCTASSDKEMLELLDCCMKANKWFAAKGIHSGQRGTKNIIENGFEMRAGVNKFTVLPARKSAKPGHSKPHKATATSLEAYQSIDFTTMQGKVASVIMQINKQRGDVTRKELEEYGFTTNAICGRVNELIELSEKHPFVFDGKPYQLKVVASRVSVCKGASTKLNEALKWVEVKVNMPEAAQMEMF